ncbi:MAG TPA: heme exporter protein CcmB [Agitococcus sp.]|nr:heme exporter protein CcmB [Agitococcus sp.]HMV59868.1 heme exporter protein CcmB [Agitococcus sp.]HMX98160.1 heme exporter protein CcmB [Agitococcus sp.]HMY27876.1 heme exporter protein CcmB [Agitococcus sp.]HMY81218.1 heme exporter protein CcmB [Agitococcus sp.]
MWPSLWAVIQRDLKLVSRQGGEWLNPLSFFLMVITLFPLAISSTPTKLAAMAGGVVWIAALLAVLLSMDSLFRQDYDDGSLEQLLVSPAPLPLVVLAKVIAHWLQTGACLTVLSPIAALLLHLPNDAAWALFITLLIGTPTLSLVSSIGAALTVSLKRGGVLIPLLTLPLHIPVLIFATAAVQAALNGLPIGGYLALLGAFLVLALTLSPLAVAAALRLAVGG